MNLQKSQIGFVGLGQMGGGIAANLVKAGYDLKGYDLVPKAITWGLDVSLKPYTDEKVASNDFKAGMCDVVFLTGILPEGKRGGSYLPPG